MRRGGRSARSSRGTTAAPSRRRRGSTSRSTPTRCTRSPASGPRRRSASASGCGSGSIGPMRPRRMATWLPVPSYLLLRLTGERIAPITARPRGCSPSTNAAAIGRISILDGGRSAPRPAAAGLCPAARSSGLITAAGRGADRFAGRHAVCARRARSPVRGVGCRRVSARRRGRFVGHRPGGADRRAGLRLHAKDGRGRLCVLCPRHRRINTSSRPG